MSESINTTKNAAEGSAVPVVPAETPAEVPATPVVANDVRTKLAEYGADETVVNKVVDELGVDTIEELASLEVGDLTGVGMKLAKARKMVADLKAPTTAAAKVPATTTAAVESRVIQNQFEALLPTVPTDESWLNALKTGGILKVDESSYIAAIRSALADRAGLYNVPDALTKAMEKYADETEEQVDPTFYALRKTMTRRAYGDIFSAIPGLDGNFITEGRRNEFLSRIRNTLWPAIADSYQTLDAWYQTYRTSLADPSVLISALSGGPAVTGMMAAPDTSAIHDAGDTLVDSINRVFRGTGVQVAAAMAYDANIISKTMEDPRLPSMVGSKNREMMLKKIGVNVSSNYIRLEQNLVKYVLGFVKHDIVTSDVDANYFIALWQLGAQINWAELGVARGGAGARPTSTTFAGLTGERVL